MSLTGGQQPRWPELSSLWVENDELGPRGLYVYRGYFIYVIRHHKAKTSTNREFVVVRFLPAELALAVFKYCAYIRPFINLLDRERGIASPSEVYQPFNRYDDRSKDAHRNVVFAWQGGHRPLQRGSTYGLDGAFPTTMQPQLLDLYEWASLRWHEFLHLPSKLTPRTNAQANSDRERVLGHQSKLTPRGTKEILTAETPVSGKQVTSAQKRHRDRLVSTRVVGSSSSTSPDQTPVPEATEDTLGRSFAVSSVTTVSSHSGLRRAIRQRQSRSTSQSPPEDEKRQSRKEATESEERNEYLSMFQRDDIEMFDREPRRLRQAQTARDEVRHYHNGSTKRSNYELRGSKDTTPPAKRRRTIPLSLTSQDIRDQSPNKDD
jgi:hypothetical protein